MPDTNKIARDQMLREETFGGAVLISLLLVACLGWYFGFVKPSQAALLDRTECATSYQDANPTVDPQDAWKVCGR